MTPRTLSLQGIAAMALTFPLYFPSAFLGPVVKAEANAEREFRIDVKAVPFGDAASSKRAVTKYIKAVALAFAHQACEGARAGDPHVAVSRIAWYVEDFLRRLTAHVYYQLADLNLRRGWGSWEGFEREMQSAVIESPEWADHLAERAAVADRSYASSQRTNVQVQGAGDETADAFAQEQADASKSFKTTLAEPQLVTDDAPLAKKKPAGLPTDPAPEQKRQAVALSELQGGADSSAPPAATGALNPPMVVATETRALWLERELKKRRWTVHDLEGHNGPSWKTGRKMLDASPAGHGAPRGGVRVRPLHFTRANHAPEPAGRSFLSLLGDRRAGGRLLLRGLTRVVFIVEMWSGRAHKFFIQDLDENGEDCVHEVTIGAPDPERRTFSCHADNWAEGPASAPIRQRQQRAGSGGVIRARWLDAWDS